MDTQIYNRDLNYHYHHHHHQQQQQQQQQHQYYDYLSFCSDIAIKTDTTFHTLSIHTLLIYIMKGKSFCLLMLLAFPGKKGFIH